MFPICAQLIKTPALDQLSEGPLPREKCAANLAQPIRLGTSNLVGFSVDEVWDFMFKPIYGLQCAILVERHEMPHIPYTEKYVVRILRCSSIHCARSSCWL